jgi:hypothetical protein
MAQFNFNFNGSINNLNIFADNYEDFLDGEMSLPEEEMTPQEQEARDLIIRISISERHHNTGRDTSFDERSDKERREPEE